jgi:3-oxoacyl-[acyl-carrier protein] reductase
MSRCETSSWQNEWIFNDSPLELAMIESVRRVALVTGSATGVGRAAILRFAREGFAVAVNYSRSDAEARQTMAEVRDLGVPAILCRCNVADDAAVRSMVKQCIDELGGLDVLVNNAGTTHFIAHTDLEAVTDKVWDDIIGVNVKGTFSCCRAAVPYLRERRGSIVNVTSVAGLQGYGSSINCMTQSLARAFAPEVRVNAVAPGPILTRWLADHQDMVEQLVRATPLGRAAQPEDIADVIWFLAKGTSLMTGQIVVVDGGKTM